MKEVHPVIISASRRTDLPAFFMQDFLKSWKRGYTLWKNPFNPKQIKKVFFDKTKVVVFWSKYPSGYMRHIKQIDFPHYMLFTLNLYPELEKNLPPFEKRVAIFREVSKTIGSEKVIWRFDPIVLVEGLIDAKEIVRRFAVVAKALEGFTKRVIISFMTPYRRAVSRMKKSGLLYHEPTMDEVEYIAASLSEIADEHGMEVQSCADRFAALGILESMGVKRGACIDKEYILRVFRDVEGIEAVVTLKKDKGQRSLCLCAESVDVGEYGTCKFNCLYCYAI